MTGAPSIHCMQGRLLPPRGDRIQGFPVDAWQEEFELGRDAGIEGIEWIYEVQGEAENPLVTDPGIVTITELASRYGVAVDSLVGDWFMDRPLLGDPAAGLEKLRWLIARAAAAGITRIVLPFVDASGVGEDDLDELATTLAAVVPDAEGAGVELHLETPLAPEPFARLLGLLDGDVVKANYDSGNSASLGYDPRQEFGAYGERIGSVHIKDRVLGGTTVPLGEGDADLEAVLWLLRRGGWRRPLVLQVARETPGGEVEKVRSDAELVRAIWSRCGEPAWT